MRNLFAPEPWYPNAEMWLLVSIRHLKMVFFFATPILSGSITFRAVHAMESWEAVANARITLAVTMAIARALLH